MQGRPCECESQGAEFLVSYFDVIYAMNGMTHPGEKRMQSICAQECRILPERFDKKLRRLLSGMFRESISAVISDMVDELKKINKFWQTPRC